MALLNTADALYLGTQPVDRVYLGPNEVWSAAPPFDPVSLFANGEAGAVIDPSDFSTMFQDSAGTIPVTSVGQPVGLIKNRVGDFAHFAQNTTTKRPILRQDGGLYYLDFDGVDDWMALGSSYAMGLEVTAAAALLVRSYRNMSSGAYWGDSAGHAWGMRWSHAANSVRFVNGSETTHVTAAEGFPHVLSLRARRTGAGVMYPRVDGVDGGSKSGGASTTLYSRAWLMMGSVFNDSVDGRFYGGMFISRDLSLGELSSVEAWLSRRSGVTLP